MNSVLVAFVGMLVLAHVPIVVGAVQLRQGTLRRADRWKLVLELSDYLFLALTCCALIAAAGDVGRWWKQQELQHRLQTDDDYADTLDATRAMSHLFHDPWWEACLNTRVTAGEAWTEGRTLAADGQVLAARRKLQTAADAYRQFVETYGGKHLEEGEKPDDRAIWMAKIEENLGDVDVLLTLIDQTGKSPMEKTLFVVGPYVVAAGLAIRFAKVTAKLAGLC